MNGGEGGLLAGALLGGALIVAVIGIWIAHRAGGRK